MTTTLSATPGARLLKIGLIAGLIIAVLDAAFLAATGVSKWPGTYEWVASGLLGKAAFATPGAEWLGVAMHVLVSLVWGFIYAFAALRVSVMRTAPIPAGLVYGLIVYLAMQVVQVVARIAAPLPVSQVILLIIDHLFFIGLPTALYVSKALRKS